MAKKHKQKRWIDADVAKRTLEKFKEQVVHAVLGSVNDINGQTRDKLIQSLRTMDMWGLPQSVAGEHPICLPQGTRFVFQGAGAVAYIIEQPPQIRMIHFERELVDAYFSSNSSCSDCYYELQKLFNEHPAQEKKRHFRLAFPYTVFAVICSDNTGIDCYVYFSNEPFVSVKQDLFMACLPNVTGEGNICMFDKAYEDSIRLSFKKRKHGKAIDALIDGFWKAAFNGDILDCFLETSDGDSRLRSLWHWEKSSKDDPLFVQNVKWRRVFPDAGNGSFDEFVRQAVVCATQYEDYSIMQIINRSFDQDDYTSKMRDDLNQISKRFDSALDREIKLTQNEDTDMATPAREPDTYSRVGSGQAKERRRK